MTERSFSNLIARAKKARERAHAPYSKFKVGAAVLSARGKIYEGCNVENASFGLTVCAERNAVAKMVSEGENEISAVAVVTGAPRPATPCGACRQVIAEFGPNAKIVMANLKGTVLVENLSHLLPAPFSGRFKTAAIFLGFLLFSLPARRLPAEENRPRTPQEATDALEQYSKDPNPHMRILMAQMIGETGGPKAPKTLRKLFRKEKDASVRRAILIQLTGLMPEGRDSADFFCDAALEDADPETRRIALNQASLMARGEGSESQLRETSMKVLKRDDYKNNRVLAAIILREQGDLGTEIAELVLDGLTDQTLEIRRRAASVIQKVADFDALQKVRAAAKDPDAEVRANLCRPLGASGNRSVIVILKDLAQDMDSAVRREALAGLSNFHEEDATLAPFLDALNDKDPHVRLESVGALERYGNPKVIPALEKTAAGDADTSVRQLARKAIAALKTPE